MSQPGGSASDPFDHPDLDYEHHQPHQGKVAERRKRGSFRLAATNGKPQAASDDSSAARVAKSQSLPACSGHRTASVSRPPSPPQQEKHSCPDAEHPCIILSIVQDSTAKYTSPASTSACTSRLAPISPDGPALSQTVCHPEQPVRGQNSVRPRDEGLRTKVRTVTSKAGCMSRCDLARKPVRMS